MENETKTKIVGEPDKANTQPIVDTPEQTAQKEQARTTKNKAQFLKVYGDSMGIVKIACDAIGVGRTTFYEWYNEDPEFRKGVEAVKIAQLGEVEDRFLKAIVREEPWALKMYLSRKHPEYRPKQENYIIPTTKTLEDLFDDFEKEKPETKKENETDTTTKQHTDSPSAQDQKQEGQTGAVQVEPGPGVLLGKENEEKPHTESKAKGNK